MKLIDLLVLIWLSSFSDTCQSKIDLCDKKTALANLEEVRKNAKALISEKNLKSQDDCVLGFIDTLTNGFIKNHTSEYIITLDTICRIADGYVGEAFWDITEILTFQAFDAFIEYLSLQEASSCFEKDLLKIMKWQLKDGTNPRKDKLIQLIDESIMNKKTNQKTKIYLMELKNKLIE